MDASEIIDLLGGNAGLADRLGCGQTTVSMWRRYGIPASRCMGLAAIARQCGLPALTLEVLMRSQPRDRSDPSEPPPMAGVTAKV